MILRYSYALLAPIYDWVVAGATAPLRRHSLKRISTSTEQNILLAGVGTGLDFAYLPDHHQYTGLDLTPQMLRRAERRIGANQRITLQRGNAMAMPYADQQFDTTILHLILAVVPEPVNVLREAARVTKPGGQILILDKFIRPGKWAPTRRLINLLMRYIATRTDVVFEQVLQQVEGLTPLSDEPALLNGWFRYITLEKRD